jgi:chorismate mutase
MTTKSEADSEPAAGAAAIEEQRRYIDRIDRTIVALLTERLRLAVTLGAIKRELAWPARSVEREAEVLERVRTAASGALSPGSAERIFHAIIAETTAAQERAHD